jgi:predicted DCC family thiol-disulfide oxidoreductase YuxK
MMKLIKYWNRYWFCPAAFFNLAICRIIIITFQLRALGFGIGLFKTDYHEFQRLSALPDFLYNPLPILRLLIWPFGWEYRLSFSDLVIVYWVTLIAGMLALLGLRTNFNLLIFAIGNIALQAFEYSFGDFHHPQSLMMIALLTLALSPAGEVLSIDDLWRRLRLNSKRRKFETFNIMDEAGAFAKWPLLLIQNMFALIYFDAALSKLYGTGFVLDWTNGFTLQYYLLQDGLRFSSDIGIWLGKNHAIVWILSWMTVLFEGTFFLVLLFPKLAWFYIPLGVAFHTGVYATLTAPFFQLIVLYTVFIPWALSFKTFYHRQRFLQSARRPQIFFNGHCPLCIRSMTMLRYFDWFDLLTFVDLKRRRPSLAGSHPEISPEDCQREMYLILPDGSVQKGFFAFRETFWYLPLLWPLLPAFYIPLAPAIGRKLYNLIASGRARFQRRSFETCLIHSSRDCSR